MTTAESGEGDRVARLAERAHAVGQVGFDTEFLPESRYRPLLCLVQVIVGDEIVVLDPIAGFDHQPLLSVFADPKVEVVVHAGRQDVAILRREWGATFTNLFDTQVAAGFAGLSAQAGYTNLLQELLGISLKKSASFTRWNARPLTAEQLQYAREDVEHLLELARMIKGRLHVNGRVEWALEECVDIANSSDERDPYDVWRRLPRVNGLRPAERAIVRELAAWRERTAASENRPVGSILRDPTVVELAKRQPARRSELDEIRGMGPDVVRRRGDQIIAVIAAAQTAAPIEREASSRVAVEPSDGSTIALAEALVRARAGEAKLAYELVASRADLTPIVVSARRGDPEPDVRTLRGWRRDLVGAELLELLAGRRELRVGADGRVEVVQQL